MFSPEDDLAHCGSKRSGRPGSQKRKPHMPWLWLTLAGLLEVVWAFALKQSQGFTRLGPSLLTGVALIGSLGLLAVAMKTLPLGTAYTVWTGIGALGAFVVGAVVFHEPIGLVRVAAALLIVAGVVMFKLSPQ